MLLFYTQTGSPFTTKVIESLQSSSDQSIGRGDSFKKQTDDTKSISSSSTASISEQQQLQQQQQQQQHINVEENPTQTTATATPTSANGKPLPIIADVKLPSGKIITGSCFQNSATGKLTVNFPREETGTYTVTLKHKKSGKIIPGSPYEVSVQAKEVKTTMTAHGNGLKEAVVDTTNCFTVFGSKGVKIQDVCILVFGPYPCKVRVVQNDWDSFDILYEVKRAGSSYQFYIHENGKDIPGSPFLVLAKGARTKNTASSTTTTSQILASYVATVWHGQASADLKTLTAMTSPSGHKVSHSVARKGKHLLEIRFLPSQNGNFLLDLFKESAELKQQFKIKIETLSASNESVFNISGHGLHTAIAKQPAIVSIHSMLPSLKSFSVEFDGPGAVDIVQQKSEGNSISATTSSSDVVAKDPALTSSSGCTIEYVGHLPGSYAMSIKYDGFHVEGSPFRVDILPAHAMLSDVPFDNTTSDNNSIKNNNEAIPDNDNKVNKKEISSSSPKASRCIVVDSNGGPTINNVLVGKPTSFTVNTSRAGQGVLMAGFHTSTGGTEVKCKHLGNSVHEVHYTIGEIGIHKLSVFWSGENIPGSPFDILVSSAHDENNNPNCSSC